jgi:LysR family transcriptional regulator, low CO2-responsive transcriptional regulator
VFADHLNFTRAAEELHISQPALHVKIRKLSSAVGTTLYAKDGRRLELTAAGRSLAGFARTLEHELDEFFTALGAPAAEPLTLAAGEGAYRYVVAGAVRLLIARGERLRLLGTDRDETIEAVRSGRALVGVTVLGSPPGGLASVPLATYPQVAIVPVGHPLARPRTIRLEGLDGAELVMPPPGAPQREALEHAAADRGVSFTVAAEAEGWAQMLHFVGLGVGICVVNGCVEPMNGMVARQVDDLPPVTYSAIFRPGGKRDSDVTRLLETLQSSVP